MLYRHPSCALHLSPCRHGGLVNVQVRLRREIVMQRILANIDPVAIKARKHDAQFVAVIERANLYCRLLRGRVRQRSVGGDEVERHAVHLGVLGVEPAVVVDGVGASTQRTPDNLLAQQPGTKGTDTENVGDRVGVPTFGEHVHADHAAHALTEATLLANGVHHFAQQVLIVEGLDIDRWVTTPQLDLVLLDLMRGGLLEVILHSVAGLQLSGVDQDRARAGDPRPIIHVRQQLQLTRTRACAAIGLLNITASNPLVHKAGHQRVRAHHDEHRWCLTELLQLGFPLRKCLCVTAIQAPQRAFQGVRDRPQSGGLINLRLAFRQASADVLPNVPVRQRVRRCVVVHRQARHLHDARLDRIHQREIRDHPRKDEPLVVTRPVQIERGRRQVVHRLDTQLAPYRVQPLEPHARIRVTFKIFLVDTIDVGIHQRLVLIAVMRFVVEHHDLTLTTTDEITHRTRHHLIGCLHERVHRLAVLQDLARVRRDTLDLLAITQQELVIVHNQQLRLMQRAPQITGDQVTLAVVVALIAREQHTQTIANRDARGDDQEPFREACIVRRVHLVDRLPRNQHRHHHGLARTRGHLQRDTRQPIVMNAIVRLQTTAVIRSAMPTRHLSQKDRRLGSLTLTKQHPVLTGRISPMLHQFARDRRDTRIATRPPQIDRLTNVIDERVHLAPLTHILKTQRGLFTLDLATLVAHRHRNERLTRPTPHQQRACRRSIRSQLEVLGWWIVRRIDHRIGEIDCRIVATHKR